MEGHGTGGIEDRSAGHPPTAPVCPACDRNWAADLRSALYCAGTLLGLLLLTDEASETFTPVRAALWCGLGLLVFLVLFPPRITAGEGWLAVRGALRTRRVRTDRLVSVHLAGSTGQRLLLRADLGCSVELDPRVLAANPPLWHRLDTDARVSAAHGHLPHGSTGLHRLSERVDRETARTVFKISGLE